MPSASTSTATTTYATTYNRSSYNAANNNYNNNAYPSGSSAAPAGPSTSVSHSGSGSRPPESMEPPRQPATLEQLSAMTRIPESDAARLPLKSTLR